MTLLEKTNKQKNPGKHRKWGTITEYTDVGNLHLKVKCSINTFSLVYSIVCHLYLHSIDWCVCVCVVLATSTKILILLVKWGHFCMVGVVFVSCDVSRLKGWVIMKILTEIQYKDVRCVVPDFNFFSFLFFCLVISRSDSVSLSGLLAFASPVLFCSTLFLHSVWPQKSLWVYGLKADSCTTSWNLMMSSITWL